MRLWPPAKNSMDFKNFNFFPRSVLEKIRGPHKNFLKSRRSSRARGLALLKKGAWINEMLPGVIGGSKRNPISRKPENQINAFDEPTSALDRG
ncbi:MAG: hypothetical protein CM15mP85_24510 [Rhodobacterales bacterium]|nr:MAG: hypothetical protein CM15mP85_24510 [Rhodobacterales bacterium]